MNIRVLIGVSLVGLAAWAYKAYQWLQSVVVYQGFEMLSDGLETLWKAWPVLTAGLILGLIAFLVCLELAGTALERKEERLKAEAEKHLSDELQRLHELNRDKNIALESREAALAEGWQTLRAQEQQAVQVLTAMSARVEAAERKAAEAEARKQRAYGGFERLRRKQQRETE